MVSGEGILLDVRGVFAKVTWQGQAVWLKASQVWRIPAPLVLKGVVPTITPAPNISVNWCSRVADWGDTYWAWGSGDWPTITAIQAANGGRPLVAGKTYKVPCN
jgi:hypothetical protein